MTDVTYTELRRGEETFQNLRRELGVESFGIKLLTLEPGQRQRVHVHERQEEVYLVLEGILTLMVEGEPHELGVDQMARVGPEVRRQVTNTHRERVVVLALGGAGEQHESRDALAWTDWDEEGPGRRPQEVPLPDDLPI